LDRQFLQSGGVNEFHAPGTARQYDAFAFLRQHRASSLEPGDIVLNDDFLNIEAQKKGRKSFL
jgi:hypothetical protein